MSTNCELCGKGPLEEIKEIVSAHPVGPHRRLYLLLRVRAALLQREKGAEPRYCACGARITNINPKVRFCSICAHDRPGTAAHEREQWEERLAWAIDKAKRFDGPQARRITLDDYERR